jgi:hypothetical protein
MERLDEVIRGATRQIQAEYFLLPIHGAPAQRRERVYCYELYHQMRTLWPKGTQWLLNGEVDKGGHPQFANEGALKPDFLVHVPGENRNFAALEVKARVSAHGLRKDLNTLQQFRARQYARCILLVYGVAGERTVRSVRSCGATRAEMEGIELWIHEQPGQAAEQVLDWLAN